MRQYECKFVKSEVVLCNLPHLAGDIHELHQTNVRIQSQLHEAQQREKMLVRRLTAKEQETQDYMVSISPIWPMQNVLNYVLVFVRLWFKQIG